MKRNLTRLLTTAALTVAATGLIASNATAAVEIANPGDIELNGELTPTITGGAPLGDCQLNITASVYSDGSATLVPETPEDNECYAGEGGWLDPCDQGEFDIWGGSIVGPGDPDYTATGDYELLVFMCNRLTEWFSVPVTEQRFSIDQEGAGESWTFHDQQIFPGSSSPYDEWEYRAHGSYDSETTELGITTVE